MITLAVRSVAARMRVLLLSLLAVALGGGLTTAAFALQDSADRLSAAGGTASWRLEAAPVVVTGRVPAEGAALAASPSGEPVRLPPATVAEIAALPGVDRVETEAPFPAYVLADGRPLGGMADRSWGHSWALADAEPAAPVTGRGPRRPGEVTVDERTAAEAGLAVGDRARVLTPEGVVQARVSGTVASRTAERSVFFPPGTAERLGGDPVAALVWPSPGTDPLTVAEAVREAAPQTRVLTGAARSDALLLDRTERELTLGMGRFLGTMAGLALAVAAVMVASLAALTVRDRLREFALLRLAGATPGRIRRLVLGEALVVGGLAVPLACGVGVLLVEGLVRLFDHRGVLPHGFEPVVGWPSLAAGAAVSVAVPLVASWRPARTAGRTPPVEALRAAEIDPAPLPRLRTAAGVGAACAGAGLLAAAVVAAGTQGAVVAALFGAAVLVLGAVLLAPLLVRGALPLLLRAGGRGPVALLVLRDLRADPRRAAGTLVPLLVTTAVAVLLLFQGPTTDRALLHIHGERIAAQAVVSGATGVGLPDRVVRTAERVPGVAAAGGFRQTATAAVGPGGPGPSLPTYLVDPAAVPHVYRLGPVEGSWEDFGAGTVALHADVAREHGWAVGDTATLLGPDGVRLEARVAVVYRAGLDFPRVLLPRESLAPRMLDSMAGAVYVAFASDADPAQTLRALERALDADPATLVTDRAAYLHRQEQLGAEDDWILHLMVALVAGYAGISAVHSLLVSVGGRGRRFALLRLVGASPRQVVGVVAAEALLVCLTALLVGSGVAFLGLAAVSYALTGGTVVLAVAADQYAAVVTVVTAVGLAASTVPAAVALRSRPLHAARRS